MTCTDYARWFSPYVDGLLIPAQRAELESHLQQCAGCRQAVVSLQQMLAALKTMKTPETPHLLPGIHQRLTRSSGWERLAVWGSDRNLWHAAALATTAILVIAIISVPRYISRKNVARLQGSPDQVGDQFSALGKTKQQPTMIAKVARLNGNEQSASAREWTPKAEKKSTFLSTGISAPSKETPAPQPLSPRIEKAYRESAAERAVSTEGINKLSQHEPHYVAEGRFGQSMKGVVQEGTVQLARAPSEVDTLTSSSQDKASKPAASNELSRGISSIEAGMSDVSGVARQTVGALQEHPTPRASLDQITSSGDNGATIGSTAPKSNLFVSESAEDHKDATLATETATSPPPATQVAQVTSAAVAAQVTNTSTDRATISHADTAAAAHESVRGVSMLFQMRWRVSPIEEAKSRVEAWVSAHGGLAIATNEHHLSVKLPSAVVPEFLAAFSSESERGSLEGLPPGVWVTISLELTPVE